MDVNKKIYEFHRRKLEKTNKKTFIAKGTPGVGDFMFALNVAHFRSFVLQNKINLVMEWFHDENFLFHYEDPETIIERFDYIHSFYYKDKSEVQVTHRFNSQNTSIYAKRYWPLPGGISKVKNAPIPENTWIFKEKQPITFSQNNKIVIWSPMFNAQDPRAFKIPFPVDKWYELKMILEFQGYEVVFIDYRTPIREVFYHISTSLACISYEGMWHYVCKNFNKPHIVLTKDNITRLHTPKAYIYKVRKAENHELSFFYNFNEKLETAKKLAVTQEKMIKDFIYAN